MSVLIGLNIFNNLNQLSQKREKGCLKKARTTGTNSHNLTYRRLKITPYGRDLWFPSKVRQQLLI